MFLSVVKNFENLNRQKAILSFTESSNIYCYIENKDRPLFCYFYLYFDVKLCKILF